MNDFDRFLEHGLRRMLDPVVTVKPPSRRRTERHPVLTVVPPAPESASEPAVVTVTVTPLA